MRALCCLILGVQCAVSVMGGTALSFDGSNDYLDSNTVDPFQFSTNLPFSISAWFTITDGGVGPFNIAGNLPVSGGQARGIRLQRGNGGDSNMRLVIWGANALSEVAWTDEIPWEYDPWVWNPELEDYEYVPYPNSLANGKWHHVVGTRENSTTLKLYVDGRLVATDDAVTPRNVDTPGEMWVGADNWSSAIRQPWPGELDDVMIYNRALSLPEVEHIFASRNAVYPVAGLLACWRMAGHGKSTGQGVPSGATVKDVSGNGHHATVQNGGNDSTVVSESATREARGRR